MIEEGLTDERISSLINPCDHNDDDLELVDVEQLGGPELVEFARYDHEAILEELLQLPSGPQRILEAADEHGVTLLHLLAALGASALIDRVMQVLTRDDHHSTARPAFLNRQNDQGNTSLHWACLNGHLEVVKVLLAHGANPGIANAIGREPIFEAEQGGHGNLVGYLVEQMSPSDCNAEDSVVEQNATITADDDDDNA